MYVCLVVALFSGSLWLWPHYPIQANTIDCRGLSVLLAQLRANPSGLIERLRLSSHDFDVTFSPVVISSSSQSHQGHGVVVRMRLRDGRVVAVKFSPRNDGMRDPNHQFLIHHILAEGGDAPNLHGFLAGADAASLRDQLAGSGIEIPHGGLTVVAMEELPNLWVFPQSHQTPTFVAQWSLETMQGVLGRLAQIRDDCDRLGIYPRDLHLFVTEGNPPRVVLGDLDHYYFMDSPPAHLRQAEQNSDGEFNRVVSILVTRWERASRVALPPNLYQSITGFQRIRIP